MNSWTEVTKKRKATSPVVSREKERREDMEPEREKEKETDRNDLLPDLVDDPTLGQRSQQRRWSMLSRASNQSGASGIAPPQ